MDKHSHKNYQIASTNLFNILNPVIIGGIVEWILPSQEELLQEFRPDKRTHCTGVLDMRFQLLSFPFPLQSMKQFHLPGIFLYTHFQKVFLKTKEFPETLLVLELLLFPSFPLQLSDICYLHPNNLSSQSFSSQSFFSCSYAEGQFHNMCQSEG